MTLEQHPVDEPPRAMITRFYEPIVNVTRAARDRSPSRKERAYPYLSRGYLIANISKSRFRETRPRVAVRSAIRENQSRV